MLETAPLLQLQGIHKSFGPLEVLKGVDFSLNRSQVACLIGPSGSGKTTLLRCINQLETIDSGRIWVDDELMGLRELNGHLVELSDRAIAHQRASIGMVFQQFNLFPHMSVLENVIEAPIRVGRVPRDEAEAYARELLDRVGLAEKVDRYPSQLSGGQQQRVAIARALAMRPKLMLFDEPTSALDPELVGEVLSVMKDLALNGTTMVVVTHEIGFARDVADVITFMDQGQVIDSGSPGELLDDTQHPRIKSFLNAL